MSDDKTTFELPEWRGLCEVLAEPGLALALDPHAEAHLSDPSFYIYAEGLARVFEVKLHTPSGPKQSLPTLVVVDDEDHQLDDWSSVRAFDVSEGCPIPWPQKPYPSVEDYFRRRRAAEKAKEIKELEDAKRRADAHAADLQARLEKVKAAP